MDPGSSEPDHPSTFVDSESEARYWRTYAADLQDQLDSQRDELQAGTTDLESTVQEVLETAQRQLRATNERLQGELDDSKARHQTALREHTNTMAHMQRELEQIRKIEQDLRLKVRDMEVDNDDLEKSERAKSSTLADLETQRSRDIERMALLEEELVSKARLEEEIQRLKDELREADEELSVLRRHQAFAPLATERPLTPPGGDASNHLVVSGASMESDAPLAVSTSSSTGEPETTPRKPAENIRSNGVPNAVVVSRIPSPRKSTVHIAPAPLSPASSNESPILAQRNFSTRQSFRQPGSVASHLEGVKARIRQTGARPSGSHLPVKAFAPMSATSRSRSTSMAKATPSRAFASGSIARSIARGSATACHPPKVTPPAQAYRDLDEFPDDSPLATRADYPHRPPSRASASGPVVARPLTPSARHGLRSPTPGSAMFAASSLPRPPSSLGRPSSALERPMSASARRRSIMPLRTTAESLPTAPGMRRISMKSPSIAEKTVRPLTPGGTVPYQPKWR